MSLSIDAAYIGVTAKDGVITLTGHVSSHAEKLAAEAATRRVKGVRAVVAEIEVRYPGQAKTCDDEIAKRALNVLRWNVTVPDTVQVTVAGVSVRGEVPRCGAFAKNRPIQKDKNRDGGRRHDEERRLRIREGHELARRGKGLRHSERSMAIVICDCGVRRLSDG